MPQPTYQMLRDFMALPEEGRIEAVQHPTLGPMLQDFLDAGGEGRRDILDHLRAKDAPQGVSAESVRQEVGSFNPLADVNRDVLTGSAVQTVPALIGGIAGSRFGKVGSHVGSAIGSGLGYLADELRQGKTPRLDVGALRTALGGLPMGKMAPTMGRNVARRAIQGGVMSTGGLAAETGLVEGRIPTAEEAVTSLATGGAFGGVLGGGEYKLFGPRPVRVNPIPRQGFQGPQALPSAHRALPPAPPGTSGERLAGDIGASAMTPGQIYEARLRLGKQGQAMERKATKAREAQLAAEQKAKETIAAGVDRTRGPAYFKGTYHPGEISGPEEGPFPAASAGPSPEGQLFQRLRGEDYPPPPTITPPVADWTPEVERGTRGLMDLLNTANPRARAIADALAEEQRLRQSSRGRSLLQRELQAEEAAGQLVDPRVQALESALGEAEQVRQSPAGRIGLIEQLRALETPPAGPIVAPPVIPPAPVVPPTRRTPRAKKAKAVPAPVAAPPPVSQPVAEVAPTAPTTGVKQPWEMTWGEIKAIRKQELADLPGQVAQGESKFASARASFDATRAKESKRVKAISSRIARLNPSGDLDNVDSASRRIIETLEGERAAIVAKHRSEHIPFRQSFVDQEIPKSTIPVSQKLHIESIQQALDSGKPVPPHVIAEYPDLVTSSRPPVATPPTSPPTRTSAPVVAEAQTPAPATPTTPHKVGVPFATIGEYEFAVIKGGLKGRPASYHVGMRRVGSTGAFEGGNYGFTANPDSAIKRWASKEVARGQQEATSFAHPSAQSIFTQESTRVAKVAAEKQAADEALRAATAASNARKAEYDARVEAFKLPVGKKQTITLHSGDKDTPPSQPTATVYGLWAIEKRGSEYVVTHIPSGKAAGNRKSLSDAKTLVKAYMESGLDVSSKDVEYNKEVMNQLSKIHKYNQFRDVNDLPSPPQAKQATAPKPTKKAGLPLGEKPVAVNPRVVQIDAELARLQAQYEKKMGQQGRSAMVPPAIKADALRSITKQMDKLDAERKALIGKATPNTVELGMGLPFHQIKPALKRLLNAYDDDEGAVRMSQSGRVQLNRAAPGQKAGDAVQAAIRGHNQWQGETNETLQASGLAGVTRDEDVHLLKVLEGRARPVGAKMAQLAATLKAELARYDAALKAVGAKVLVTQPRIDKTTGATTRARWWKPYESVANYAPHLPDNTEMVKYTPDQLVALYAPENPGIAAADLRSIVDVLLARANGKTPPRTVPDRILELVTAGHPRVGGLHQRTGLRHPDAVRLLPSQSLPAYFNKMGLEIELTRALGPGDAKIEALRKSNLVRQDPGITQALDTFDAWRGTKVESPGRVVANKLVALGRNMASMRFLGPSTAFKQGSQGIQVFSETGTKNFIRAMKDSFSRAGGEEAGRAGAHLDDILREVSEQTSRLSDEMHPSQSILDKLVVGTQRGASAVSRVMQITRHDQFWRRVQYLGTKYDITDAITAAKAGEPWGVALLKEHGLTTAATPQQIQRAAATMSAKVNLTSDPIALPAFLYKSPTARAVFHLNRFTWGQQQRLTRDFAVPLAKALVEGDTAAIQRHGLRTAKLLGAGLVGGEALADLLRTLAGRPDDRPGGTLPEFLGDLSSGRVPMKVIVTRIADNLAFAAFFGYAQLFKEAVLDPMSTSQKETRLASMVVGPVASSMIEGLAKGTNLFTTSTEKGPRSGKSDRDRAQTEAIRTFLSSLTGVGRSVTQLTFPHTEGADRRRALNDYARQMTRGNSQKARDALKWFESRHDERISPHAAKRALQEYTQ